MSSYPLNQSPLFKLTSKHKLSELLGVELGDLESLLANDEALNYKVFRKETRKGKQRLVEWPKPQLRKMQRRIADLLGRIVPPMYLHSAYKGRSYITNAKEHPFGLKTAKIDIKAFFPSIDHDRVSWTFRNIFQCSPDVGKILQKLTTFRAHVPTGGNSSTIISFWAYKTMFDRIAELAAAAGLKMTCCVDDMTFTGNRATPKFINEVRIVIRSYGLKTSKEKFFTAKQSKIITGVAITRNGPRLPNVRRKLLHDAYQEVHNEDQLHLKKKKAEAYLGRATEAEQIESRFGSERYLASKRLNEVKAMIRIARGKPKV